MARLRAGRDDDMRGSERAVADLQRIGSDEFPLPADDLDAAPRHRCGEAVGNAGDHLLFACDQRRPIERRRGNRDAVVMRPRDLVERMRGGNQHLFRHTAAIGAGAAQIAHFDHRDREPGLAGPNGHAHGRIAAAEDDNVVAFGAHRLCLPPGCRQACLCPAGL